MTDGPTVNPKFFERIQREVEDELRRRLTAAMLHYGITRSEIAGYLFVTTIKRSDAKLASARAGEITVGRLGGALDRSIVRRRVDAVFLDPFIKTHSVPENDNAAIDYVANPPHRDFGEARLR